MRQRTFFIIGAVLILGAVFAAVAVAQSTGTEKSRSATTECTPEMMESMKGNMTESCTSKMMEGMKGNMTEGCTPEMMEHMGDKNHTTVSNHCGGADSMMSARGNSKGSMM